MKTSPEIPGRAYTARELKGLGVVLMLMGLFIAFYFHSIYRHGSDPRMVSTKWGTIMLSANPPKSPVNLIWEGAGFILAASGLIPLVKGMRKK